LSERDKNKEERGRRQEKRGRIELEITKSTKEVDTVWVIETVRETGARSSHIHVLRAISLKILRLLQE
jgi:hypothetical protein